MDVNWATCTTQRYLKRFTLWWKGSLKVIKNQSHVCNWAKIQLTIDTSQLYNILNLVLLEHREAKKGCYWRRRQTHGENSSQEESTYEKSKNHTCSLRLHQVVCFVFKDFLAGIVVIEAILLVTCNFTVFWVSVAMYKIKLKGKKIKFK